MNSKTALERKVTEYHEQRLKKWYRILTLISGLLVSVVCILTCTIQYQLHVERTSQHVLSLQHTQLVQQWSSLQKAAKEFKTRKDALQKLSPTQLPLILQALSDSIPSHTLITMFEFESPQTFCIKGYSESEEELGAFIEHLGSQFPIMLAHITHNPHALYFEIGSRSYDKPYKASTRHHKKLSEDNHTLNT